MRMEDQKIIIQCEVDDVLEQIKKLQGMVSQVEDNLMEKEREERKVWQRVLERLG